MEIDFASLREIGWKYFYRNTVEIDFASLREIEWKYF
jgi:hypothetical protein